MKILLQLFGGRGSSSGGGGSSAVKGGGGASISSQSANEEDAINKIMNMDTKFTKAEIAMMPRDMMETFAHAIAIKRAFVNGITPKEALRRSRLLMSAQSDAQLRKYIKKYG